MCGWLALQPTFTEERMDTGERGYCQERSYQRKCVEQGARRDGLREGADKKGNSEGAEKIHLPSRLFRLAVPVTCSLADSRSLTTRRDARNVLMS